MPGSPLGPSLPLSPLAPSKPFGPGRPLLPFNSLVMFNGIGQVAIDRKLIYYSCFGHYYYYYYFKLLKEQIFPLIKICNTWCSFNALRPSITLLSFVSSGTFNSRFTFSTVTFFSLLSWDTICAMSSISSSKTFISLQQGWNNFYVNYFFFFFLI